MKLELQTYEYQCLRAFRATATLRPIEKGSKRAFVPRRLNLFTWDSATPRKIQYNPFVMNSLRRSNAVPDLSRMGQTQYFGTDLIW